MSANAITAAPQEAIAACGSQHRIRCLTWLDAPRRAGPDADSATRLIEFNPADMPPRSQPAALEDKISCDLDRKTDRRLYRREMYLGCEPGEAGIIYHRDDYDYMDIPLPRDQIAEFCARKSVGWLARLSRLRRASVTEYVDVDLLTLIFWWGWRPTLNCSGRGWKARGTERKARPCDQHTLCQRTSP